MQLALDRFIHKTQRDYSLISRAGFQTDCQCFGLEEALCRLVGHLDACLEEEDRLGAFPMEVVRLAIHQVLLDASLVEVHLAFRVEVRLDEVDSFD